MSGHIERPRTTCALGGAITTLSLLPGVIPVTHSAIGCGGNLYGAIATCAGNLGEGTIGGSHIPSSAIGERDVVFGGVDRLEEELRATKEIMDGKLVVVATGCMTEMIGDDVQGVVRELEEDDIDVIAISTASFKGDAYRGYEIALDGIFNRYLPATKEKKQKLLNIFGIVPGFDPFFRGDLEEIRRLLKKIGFEVNTFFTGDQTFENITSAPEASYNLLFSSVWGRELVETFEERHGTPYGIYDLPIGAVATEEFLRRIGTELAVDQELLEKVIQEENNHYYSYFLRAADIIANGQYFYYAEIIANSNYAIPLQKFVSEELGWHADDIFVTDILKEEKANALRKHFEESDVQGELLFESGTSEIGRLIAKRHPRNQGQRYFDSDTPLFLLGSGIDKYTASELGAQTLAVSYPVSNRLICSKGYAGFEGGLHLLEDIISVLVAGK
ncbi:MAG: hypothetical protein LUI12_06295 [Clostridiales bacterium]|nr:hypothetical protein [Clostridiales bacterium]